MTRRARRALLWALPVVMVSAACGAFGGTGSAPAPSAEGGPGNVDATAVGDTTVAADTGRADSGLDAESDAGQDVRPIPLADSGIDSGRYKRVFITANAYALPPTITGLLGLDNACNTEGVPKLGGTWMAWASDDTVAAKDRFTGAGLVGPFYSLATPPVKIFNPPGPAGGAVPLAPITYAPALGGPVDIGAQYAWTGTLAAGLNSGASCASWTAGDGMKKATVGYSGSTGTAAWVNAPPDQPCTAAFNHLYCFER